MTRTSFHTIYIKGMNPVRKSLQKVSPEEMPVSYTHLEAAALIAGLLIGRSVFLFKNSKSVRALAVVYVIMLIIAYIVIS